MLDLLKQVEELSREVGNFLKNERAGIQESDIEFKGRTNDLVSRADKEAEKQFVERLAQVLPEAGFIAEEGTSNKKGDRFNWIIDPLDGTTNYLYRIPCYCTSVALMDGNEIVLGVIYDPERNECFSALKGNGAHLNGENISVSNQSDLSRSLIATGFPYDNRGRQREYLDILENVNQSTRGIRRLGSAALDLAYVACARFDAFYEYGLNPWDCAAGALIIKEAGGTVTDFKSGENYLFGKTILATNTRIHQEMMRFTQNWD